jgi:hypothetical protein
MTSNFEYVVYSIKESNDLNTLTIDEQHNSLLFHEKRMNGHRGEEQALKITYEDNTTRGRGQGVFRGKRKVMTDNISTRLLLNVLSVID